MKSALEILTKGQLQNLREAGFVVIHREPTIEMRKAFYAKNWPEGVVFEEAYHRMVSTSINQQNET